jgi:hypothetical protein
MNKIVVIVALLLIEINVYSQSVVTIGGFPVLNNTPSPITCSEILGKLNWETVKKYDGSEKNDSLTTTYEYIRQEWTAWFKVRCFKEHVMEYESGVALTTQITETKYFDKKIWLSYVQARLPKLPDEYKLSINEQEDIFKSYYQLLGVDTRDEYGWICEYGMIGKPAPKRLAVLTLVKNQRRDLLKKLLGYDNIQTQLYAADALIYLDFKVKEQIKQYSEWKKEKEDMLDSLRGLSNMDKERISNEKSNISGYKNSIDNLTQQLLSPIEWKTIYDIRDSRKEVITCKGGTGSYRIYSGNSIDILSDENIKDIPKHYYGYNNLLGN